MMGDGDDDWGPGCRGIIALLAVFGGLGAGLVWAILEGSMGWILAAMAALLVAATACAVLGAGDCAEAAAPPTYSPATSGPPAYSLPARAASPSVPAYTLPVTAATEAERGVEQAPGTRPAPDYNPLVMA